LTCKNRLPYNLYCVGGDDGDRDDVMWSFILVPIDYSYMISDKPVNGGPKFSYHV